MDIHTYLSLLDRRLDSSAMAICMLGSQRRHLVAHWSKRSEVMEQGPVTWLQPETERWKLPEEWLMWVHAKRLKKLESVVPWWGQAAMTHLLRKSKCAHIGWFLPFSDFVPLGPRSIGQCCQIQGDPVPISHCLPFWSSLETQTYPEVSFTNSYLTVPASRQLSLTITPLPHLLDPYIHTVCPISVLTNETPISFLLSFFLPPSPSFPLSLCLCLLLLF